MNERNNIKPITKEETDWLINNWSIPMEIIISLDDHQIKRLRNSYSYKAFKLSVSIMNLKKSIKQELQKII